MPQKGFVGCFVLGQLLIFRGKELAGQEKGDPGAAGLWKRGPEGCPQPKRAFGTRIWGAHACALSEPHISPIRQICRLGTSESSRGSRSARWH